MVKGVDSKGVVEISRELGAISAKARDGKLSPAEMQGATFTISSLGGIGGTAFTPIVNAPEVADPWRGALEDGARSGMGPSLSHDLCCRSHCHTITV